LSACENKKDPSHDISEDSTATVVAEKDSTRTETAEIIPALKNSEVSITSVPPDSILAFAITLIGTPYLYASTDPEKGFDCSGFITFVFNHFNVTVPRSSVDFTNYGEEIAVEEAKPGDLILFTGTDSTIRIVGHMGIVENVRDGKLHFIHSTSGKGRGVVITPFENYYQSRFVKVIRVFADKFFNKSPDN
jgi:cell wall-associated NlpC family hydrolase